MFTAVVLDKSDDTVSCAVTDLDDAGNARVPVDFRRVYAAVLERHLGADPRTLLPGDFEPLELF